MKEQETVDDIAAKLIASKEPSSLVGPFPSNNCRAGAVRTFTHCQSLAWEEYEKNTRGVFDLQGRMISPSAIEIEYQRLLKTADEDFRKCKQLNSCDLADGIPATAVENCRKCQELYNNDKKYAEDYKRQAIEAAEKNWNDSIPDVGRNIFTYDPNDPCRCCDVAQKYYRDCLKRYKITPMDDDASPNTTRTTS